MRRHLVLFLLPALLALAGCGGSEDSSGDGGSVIQTIPISLMDGSINPNKVNLDEAGTYEFEVTNEGTVTHALDIEPEGGEEAETGNLDTGASATLRVTLSEGSHEMYCPVDGHRDQGMEGTIAVGGGAAGGGTSTDDGTTTDDNETEDTTTDDDPGY